MKGDCPVCGKNMGKNLYAHLFSVHSFSKEEIKRLQEQNRQKVLNEATATHKCDACEVLCTSQRKLLDHKREAHKEEPNMQCPLCDVKVENHLELVTHVNNMHADSEGEYTIEKASFNDRSSFEAWKRRLEDECITRWSIRSRKSYQNCTIQYMRCSRALPHPGYSEKDRPGSKKAVRYCTSFMKVIEREMAIEVEFCRRHCGHEVEPALLTMDAASESYIVSLLKEGFNCNQVLRKVRNACKTMDAMHTRLYYTTSRDIRTIAIRNNVDPARRHDVDVESVAIRVNEGNINDGIKLYTPAINESGEGFLLVIITPIQKSWLEKYAHRAVCLDDTFNLTPYALRLTTVVVADEWDMGLPAAFLLSHRMTDHEVALLFKEIKALLPTFDTAYFMTDDTNTFYNGFRKIFPESLAKKLLCIFHILQSVDRNTKKMTQSNFAPTVVGKVAELCKTSNPQKFASKYAGLLTFLRELGEEIMVEYFERNWSGRVSQWGAFARHYSCMNTSMLIERFHRRLKHEFSDSKANMRIDSLLEILISLVPFMEEDRTIKMARGLREGRHRLQEHHRAHTLAVKMFPSKVDAVQIIAEGRWTVTDNSGKYYVAQSICICDAKLNNHCQKDNCKACAYAFRCDCTHDAKSGVSCAHVHAALLYARQGMIPETRQHPHEAASASISTPNVNSDDFPLTDDVPSTSSSSAPNVISEDFPIIDDVPTTSSSDNLYVVERSNSSDADLLDKSKELLHQFDAVVAAYKAKLIGISKVPNPDAVNFLTNAVAQITEADKNAAVVSSRLRPSGPKKFTLARRSELPSVGRMPNPPAIRLAKRSVFKAKRPRSTVDNVPFYAEDDLQFCVKCFRRAPNTDDVQDSWLKCSACGMWIHEACTEGEGSLCPYDDGVLQCSVLSQ